MGQKNRTQKNEIEHLSVFDLSAILFLKSGMTRAVRVVDGVLCRSSLLSAVHFLNCISKALEAHSANRWSLLTVTSQGGQVQGQKNRTQKDRIKHLSAFDLSAKLLFRLSMNSHELQSMAFNVDPVQSRKWTCSKQSFQVRLEIYIGFVDRSDLKCFVG